jgi:hypothetical protein
MTATTIAAALQDLLLTPGVPLEAAIDKHFAPDYRQRTDGAWSDRAEFGQHIAHLRSIVVGGRIEVHEELADGPVYAERHTIELTKTDGSVVRSEVYVFGERTPDGRFQRIEETVLLLSGTEADRNIGRARS